jgi:hypothetical protein
MLPIVAKGIAAAGSASISCNKRPFGFREEEVVAATAFIPTAWAISN